MPRSTKESRESGEAKIGPEEKVRSPNPGNLARYPAPTRSHSRDKGRSVVGLRNCENRRHRQPFGWGNDRAPRKIAEATHATHESHAW